MWFLFQKVLLKEEKDFLWQVYGCPLEGWAVVLLKTVTNDPATLHFLVLGENFENEINRCQDNPRTWGEVLSFITLNKPSH